MRPQLPIMIVAVVAAMFAVLSAILRWKLRRMEQRLEAAAAASKAALAKVQALADEQAAELAAEKESVRKHYQAEAVRIQTTADEALTAAMKELEALRKYGKLLNAEVETERVLQRAIEEADALKREAQQLVDQTRAATAAERAEAVKRAQQMKTDAEALLADAGKTATRIVKQAEAAAEKISGDAYRALREKDALASAIQAARNTVEGYGDRYVVPSRSVIDELAADFGHTEAGRALATARTFTRQLVEEGLAGECDYADRSRAETAVRFVVDAFNGRVDSIISDADFENVGTLEQKIRDAYSLVNLNGAAFRNARIRESYLDARLAELKWLVSVNELREKQREEQRRIKEQMREEEKARREYERAMREAEQEEAMLKRALERAREEVASASAEQRAKYESEIGTIAQKLAEAEARNQRALSMAQQTRKGNVYVISNIGSFGENVFKIGMTRRLDPMDRVWELGDASVPFDFDVHAMIACDDAPALEFALHEEFEDERINKVNSRKEFFRVELERVRKVIETRGINAQFTMLAEAHEFRETQVLNRMSAAERARYLETAATRARTLSDVMPTQSLVR